MKKTLEVERGVGIAAAQVGISKNLFLFMRLDLPDQPVHVAVNPKIVNHPDTTVCFERDGCLSIPDRSGNSVRYPWIDVEYQNEKGEKVCERLEGYSRQNTFTAVVCFERDGCLSIPDRSGNSVRYPWIDVEYQNEKGEKVRERLEGYSRQNTFTAVIFQHEYDHTKGVLFTDKLCK
jgi:peptide deformylase